MFKLNPFKTSKALTALATDTAALMPCRAAHPAFGATTSARGDAMGPIRCGARSSLHRGKHRARLASGITLRWN